MYKLEFLSIAKNDLLEIVQYIGNELQNPVAAERLVEKMIAAVEELCQFPYAHQVYIPIKPLENEYRRVLVGHYFLFYTVDETKKTVTVMRVIYATRDLEKQL